MRSISSKPIPATKALVLEDHNGPAARQRRSRALKRKRLAALDIEFQKAEIDKPEGVDGDPLHIPAVDHMTENLAFCRETGIMRRIFAGDSDPFPNPLARIASTEARPA